MKKAIKPPEWLPDWRKETEYPDPENAAPRQWAWEFLRRNPEYGMDQEEHILSEVELMEKYSLVFETADPSKDNPFTNPLFDFLPLSRIAYDYDDSGMAHIRLGMNEVAVIFDLELSIAPQLKEARRSLTDLQRSAGVTVKQSRPPFVKFRTYIRILDAWTLGTKPGDIASILFPDISNEYPDYQGNDQVKKNLRSAIQLSEQGYKYIVKEYEKRDPPPSLREMLEPMYLPDQEDDLEKRIAEHEQEMTTLFKKKRRLKGKP